MKRRTFLATSLFLGGSGYWAYQKANQFRLGSYRPTVQPDGVWKNWSGSQSCRPTTWITPQSSNELQSWLKSSSQPVRVVGGGHSFSPLIPTPDALISLENFQGIQEINAKEQWVVVRAGTSLADLTHALFQHGFALENQGDINHQTVAGAISTSTHGTGAKLTSLGAMVLDFDLLTANGEQLSGKDWVEAGAVSLGLLGIMTQIKLKIVPSYRLFEKITPTPTLEALAQFESLVQTNRHAEVFLFFHGNTCLVKTLQPTNKPSTPQNSPLLSDDFLLSLGLSLSGSKGQRSPQILESMESVLEESSRIGEAYQIFPSPREVRFNEMEYQIPLPQGLQALKSLWELGRAEKWPIFFPMEVRVVAADSYWLSPFYQQPSLSISVHQAAHLDYAPYFKKAHTVLSHFGGRPHWGKLSFYSPKDQIKLYPKWADFQTLKMELDPTHRFTNSYFKPFFS